jgi:phosphatidylglycerophosphatase A
MSLSNVPREDVSDTPWRALPPDAAAPVSAPDSGAQPVRLKPSAPPGNGPPPPGAVRPDARFMRAHPAHLIAFGFGSGLSSLAPSTIGALWAWLAWHLLAQALPPMVMGWLLAASLPLAWWASSVTAQHLRIAAPRAIVIDAMVAFWVILWLLLPAGFGTQVWAFLLFRFFGAVKPGPVGWANRLLRGQPGWRGGFGIVLDDLVAAGCTLLVIALWRW